MRGVLSKNLKVYGSFCRGKFLGGFIYTQFVNRIKRENRITQTSENLCKKPVVGKNSRAWVRPRVWVGPGSSWTGPRENSNRIRTRLYGAGRAKTTGLVYTGAGRASASQKLSGMGTGTTAGVGWARFLLDRAARKPEPDPDSFIPAWVV